MMLLRNQFPRKTITVSETIYAIKCSNFTYAYANFPR